MRYTRITFLAVLLLLVVNSPAAAWINFHLDDPIDNLADNSAVDIVYDGTYVWLATGNGVSGTSDGGETWRTYNDDTGFPYSSISALTTDGDRVWAALAHEEETEAGTFEDWGGGIEITRDFGDSWTLVDDFEQFSARGKLAYDMAVYDSSVWAATWHGGLVRSLDYGHTWESIFIDDEVRRDHEENELPQLSRGLYFSTLVDPYHDDSVIVWAGSGEGVQRIYYIDKSKKLAGNQINDIANDSLYWWFATDLGLSRLADTLLPQRLAFTFLTYDTSDGFAGNYISAVGAEKDLICAGIYDTLAESSLGFAVSVDGGGQWSMAEPEQAIGSGRLIEGIEVQGGVIWAACNEGGFIVSVDSGSTWQSIYVDSSQTSPDYLRNVANCLDITPTEEYSRVLVGTDSGAVAFYFSEPPVVDSAIYMQAFDNSSYGQKIVSLATLTVEEEDQIWAAAHPQYFAGSDSAAPYAVLRKVPGFQGWDPYLNQPPYIIPHDIEAYILGSTKALFVAHSEGLYSTVDFGEDWDVAFFRDLFHGLQRTIPDGSAMLSVGVAGSDLYAGSESHGAAKLYVPVTQWFVFQAQTDPLQFDFVGRSWFPDQFGRPDSGEIGGNWIRALGLQPTGDSTVMWAATAPSPDIPRGRIGVSISGNRGLTWHEVAEGKTVWNFEFNGDSAFIASSDGLFLTTDFGETWQGYEIVEPSTGRSIPDNVWILSVKLIDGELWVGSNDGIAKTTDGIHWEIFRVFPPLPPEGDEEERSYVTPNPFSPYQEEGAMKFHYLLKHGGDVTISIYDFANNLVKVVADGVMREEGVQFDDVDSWDGRNERGDLVAGGVYIYLIESSGGDEIWGKFMVLP
jgi:hypothetical protein